MWHKVEVYIAIRHPFQLAWRELMNKGVTPENMGVEAAWYKFKEAIADEVAKSARIPSTGSSRYIKEYVRHPWKLPRFTKDDGVEDMSVEQIKRICLDWLNNHLEEVKEKMTKTIVINGIELYEKNLDFIRQNKDNPTMMNLLRQTVSMNFGNYKKVQDFDKKWDELVESVLKDEEKAED